MDLQQSVLDASFSTAVFGWALCGSHSLCLVCAVLPAVLWFLFLLAFGAFPIRLSTDLHYSLGTVARYPQFWLQIVVVPIACVLPVFFFRAMRR